MRNAHRLIALLLVAPAGYAHDFWIQPSSFHVTAGGPVSLQFLIGDPDAIEHWETEWRKVVTLQDIGPTGIRDLLGDLRPLEGTQSDIRRADAAFSLIQEGTHVVAFTSNQQLSDLGGEQFTAYAEHEGLALPLAIRKRAGATQTNGRELYSRRAKALIQVGRHPTGNASMRIGQTLEIVPDANPYLLKPGAPFGVQVWFHGSPLAGASVVLERLDAGARHATPVISDRNGRVRYSMPDGGSWKVNVVWSYPIDDPRAEFETIFCSLTFGSTT